MEYAREDGSCRESGGFHDGSAGERAGDAADGVAGVGSSSVSGVPDIEERGHESRAAAAAAQASSTRRPSKRERNGVLEALVLVLLALVLALTLKTYVAEAYEIKGRSMDPTFHNGERVVVLKLLYGVERGSVVIFASSDDPTKDLIKRVIGLPGEHIRIAKGHVWVDGEMLEEAYIKDPLFGRYDEPVDLRLGPDEYFVLGDNRDDSHDSRRFGPVPVEALKGKVVVRWWPFHEVTAF